MKIIKATGLVPVLIEDDKEFLSMSNGQVIGLKPDDAAKFLEKGWVSLVHIPEGIETTDTEASEPVESFEKDSIPADWREKHWKTRVKIAQQIDSAVTTDAEAVLAIETYLADPK